MTARRRACLLALAAAGCSAEAGVLDPIRDGGEATIDAAVADGPISVHVWGGEGERERRVVFGDADGRAIDVQSSRSDFTAQSEADGITQVTVLYEPRVPNDWWSQIYTLLDVQPGDRIEVAVRWEALGTLVQFEPLVPPSDGTYFVFADAGCGWGEALAHPYNSPGSIRIDAERCGLPTEEEVNILAAAYLPPAEPLRVLEWTARLDRTNALPPADVWRTPQIVPRTFMLDVDANDDESYQIAIFGRMGAQHFQLGRGDSRAPGAISISMLGTTLPLERLEWRTRIIGRFRDEVYFGALDGDRISPRRLPEFLEPWIRATEESPTELGYTLASRNDRLAVRVEVLWGGLISDAIRPRCRSWTILAPTRVGPTELRFPDLGGPDALSECSPEDLLPTSAVFTLLDLAPVGTWNEARPRMLEEDLVRRTSIAPALSSRTQQLHLRQR